MQAASGMRATAAPNCHPAAPRLPTAIENQSQNCVSAAQAAGSGEAGAGARHRWHAVERNLTGGAQTLKQVAAPPYYFRTQPYTIAGTVHEQVRLHRARPAVFFAIAHCTFRGPLPPLTTSAPAASLCRKIRARIRRGPKCRPLYFPAPPSVHFRPMRGPRSFQLLFYALLLSFCLARGADAAPRRQRNASTPDRFFPGPQPRNSPAGETPGSHTRRGNRLRAVTTRRALALEEDAAAATARAEEAARAVARATFARAESDARARAAAAARAEAAQKRADKVAKRAEKAAAEAARRAERAEAVAAAAAARQAAAARKAAEAAQREAQAAGVAARRVERQARQAEVAARLAAREADAPARLARQAAWEAAAPARQAAREAREAAAAEKAARKAAAVAAVRAETAAGRQEAEAAGGGGGAPPHDAARAAAVADYAAGLPALKQLDNEDLVPLYNIGPRTGVCTSRAQAELRVTTSPRKIQEKSKKSTPCSNVNYNPVHRAVVRSGDVRLL